MNFAIPAAFAYIGTALDWFWPVMGICVAFGLGWIARSCETPSKV